jgi:predicted AAA+ superfamily ATPase
MSNVTDSLSGRISIIELYPLSINELEVWSKEKAQGELLLDWMLKGGYPEIYEKNIPPVEFYEDYLATYLERDVRQILNVKDLGIFHRFIMLLALRSGQILNYNDLATAVGTTIKTIKSWLSVLETRHIIYLLKPYFENFSKRMVKAPKLYFLDTGLLCHLLAIRNTDSLFDSPLKGHIFETLMIVEFLKSLNKQGLPKEIYYYRDYQGNEVDLVHPENGKLNLYECKWSYQQEQIPKGMKKVMQVIGIEKLGKVQTITSNREKVHVLSNHTISNIVEW